MKWKGLLLFAFAATIIAVPVVFANQSNANEGEPADERKVIYSEEVKKLGITSLNDEAFSETGFSEEEAAKLAAEWVAKKTYVLAGGNYQEGEYKSFMHNDMYYRYLASDIDTKEELMAYLNDTITEEYANKFLEESNFIHHEGKLAQLEADGGSLLEWSKAKATLMEVIGDEQVFEIEVPIGELNETEKYEATIKQVDEQSFRVNNLTHKMEK